MDGGAVPAGKGVSMSSHKKKRRDKKKRGRPRKPSSLLSGLPADAQVVLTPPGGQKMSEVLLDFIEPYADQWRTPEDLRKLLMLASIAWNAGLMGAEARHALIEPAVESLPPDARLFFQRMIAEMIRRKETEFAHI